MKFNILKTFRLILIAWLVHCENLFETGAVEVTNSHKIPLGSEEFWNEILETDSLQNNVSLLDMTPVAQEFETPNISLESSFSEEKWIY